MSGLENDDVLHYSADVKTLLTDTHSKKILFFIYFFFCEQIGN